MKGRFLKVSSFYLSFLLLTACCCSGDGGSWSLTRPCDDATVVPCGAPCDNDNTTSDGLF